MSFEKLSGRVVVGIDGSDQAALAAEWAAAWASSRGLPMTLLAGEGVMPVSADGMVIEAIEAVREATKGILRQARDTLLAAHPGLDIDTLAVTSGAAYALVSASGKAALVVVGTRGHGGVLRAGLLGSVADQVVTHAHGPVVVVPEGAQVHAEGPIVLGSDASDSAAAATAFAFEEAKATGRPLRILSTWELRPALSVTPPEVLADEALDEFDRGLQSVLAPYRERYPDVEIDIEVKAGDPAYGLIEESKTAAMVVVGSRGRGGFTGLLLGSTSRAVLRAAHCPAAVVGR